ncbi:hypothetical protein ACTOS9_01155 [Bacillus subtilis]|uniref:Uncharacterized protein n=1 Tax=Bacillus subtilis TaxID=1423 RepID=A0AAX3RQJ6_BACIU|nr:hypothetical protein P5633_01905 [Bacillus subtilis]WGD62879.1 hypothetical protein P5648_01125 [Bacillus subtilis]WGD71315.1 hypothetical protein P5645_21250 [Bacillus subtilis]WGD76075.1 hypothetical protein P5631_01450 [Bacillus subtilis]
MFKTTFMVKISIKVVFYLFVFLGGVWKASFEWLWDRYKEGSRDKFEEVCYKIYKYEQPDAEVKRARVHQGNGGIDVYIDYVDRYIVIQM